MNDNETWNNIWFVDLVHFWESTRFLSSRTGYQVFALQAGGWCASSSTALETYKKYGPSYVCQNDGEGGDMANQVYLIKFDGKFKKRHWPLLVSSDTFLLYLILTIF